jgi:hypothetical protein
MQEWTNDKNCQSTSSTRSGLVFGLISTVKHWPLPLLSWWLLLLYYSSLCILKHHLWINQMIHIDFFVDCFYIFSMYMSVWAIFGYHMWPCDWVTGWKYFYP